MAEDIKQIIKDAAQETGKEIEGRLGVLIEAVQSDVKHILEVVDTHTEQLKRLEVVPDKLDKIEVRLDAIETTFESVDLVDLKEQVVDSQKRVAVLESKER